LKMYLIIALVLLAVSPAMAQSGSALGLPPGSVAFVSGQVDSNLTSENNASKYANSAQELASGSSALTSSQMYLAAKNSNLGFLGLPPGSVAFASGQIGPAPNGADSMNSILGSTSESDVSITGQLGFPPTNETTYWQLGLTIGFMTPYEQMELASNETLLLERLKSSQSEIPSPNQPISEMTSGTGMMNSASDLSTFASGQLGFPPTNETTYWQLGLTIGFITPYEQMELASNETLLLERLKSSQSEILLPNQFILAPFSF